MREPSPAGARIWARPTVRRLVAAAGVTALSGAVVFTAGSGGAGAQVEAVSYEAVASAEGVRFSMGAPGFVAVDTFVDGGGPVAQAVVDGLGNSTSFAALPYPGDLAISGPGLLAGLTGLPSPPPYPFYVNSSYPTKEEHKLTQPGYELAALSKEQQSTGSAMTGGTSGSSAIGSTLAKATATRDPASGAVVAEAIGMADVINIGGVLRIGQVDALAKVSRSPGADPVRETKFVINGMTIAGQTVGFSDKGFTFGTNTSPIPTQNPLLEALKQAKITVTYLARVDNPDGVVSPGLVVTQEQQMPSGPTVVMRYTFGRMAAAATVSSGSTALGDSLPVTEIGSVDSPTIEGSETVPVTETTESVALPETVDESVYDDASTSTDFSGSADTSVPAADEVASTPPDSAPVGEVQVASPIAQTPAARVDTLSIYWVLIIGAAVALGGAFVLRLVGVKLKWVS